MRRLSLGKPPGSGAGRYENRAPFLQKGALRTRKTVSAMLCDAIHRRFPLLTAGSKLRREIFVNATPSSRQALIASTKSTLSISRSTFVPRVFAASKSLGCGSDFANVVARSMSNVKDLSSESSLILFIVLLALYSCIFHVPWVY